jgi:hypothetical protein
MEIFTVIDGEKKYQFFEGDKLYLDFWMKPTPRCWREVRSSWYRKDNEQLAMLTTKGAKKRESRTVIFAVKR